MRSSTTGLLRIGLAASVWGSLAVFVRAVDASPFVIVFWRVAFAALALLLYMLVSRRLRELRRIHGRTLLALLGLGALVALNWVLFLGALTLTQVAVAVLLGYCGPVFVAALAPAVTGERFDRRIVLPLGLALAGTAVIVGLGDVVIAGGRSALGAAMAFGSALTYSGLTVGAKRLLHRVPATVMMLTEDSFATLLMLPAVIILPGPTGLTEWGALATLGVVHTALAVLLFLSGLRRVRADQAAVVTYAEPVTAVLFAAVFLGERISWTIAVGGGAVIAAGVMVARLAPSSGLEAPTVEADAARAVADRHEEAVGRPEGATRRRGRP